MNWTSSVNGEPGIFTEVMEALKTLTAENKHCYLYMDAMALQKQILWSDKFNKFVGYCDFGGELQLEGLDVPATEALVFMLVSLNGRWKLPIANVLQNKISAIALSLLRHYLTILTKLVLLFGESLAMAHTQILP